MNKFTCFLGIDVSKKIFDAALLIPMGDKPSHAVFAQSKQGMDDFSLWLKKAGINMTETLFCMGIPVYIAIV